MNATAPKSTPLPCALLALSVAVCLGAASPAHATAIRSAATAQAEQRESLVHLLDVIQQAAKKLTERLDGQAALHDRHGAIAFGLIDDKPVPAAGEHVRAVLFLRDALLNLPPPSCSSRVRRAG